MIFLISELTSLYYESLAKDDVPMSEEDTTIN